MTQLKALRELSLASNQLTSLPESLGRLTSLRRLYLYENQDGRCQARDRSDSRSHDKRPIQQTRPTGSVTAVSRRLR